MLITKNIIEELSVLYFNISYKVTPIKAVLNQSWYQSHKSGFKSNYLYKHPVRNLCERIFISKQTKSNSFKNIKLRLFLMLYMQISWKGFIDLNWKVKSIKSLGGKKTQVRVGKMTQWLTAVVALPEDLSLIPCTHVGYLTISCISSSRESDTSSFYRYLDSWAHIYKISVERSININKNNKNILK